MSANGMWRLDAGLVKSSLYKKRFAYLPKTCSDGTKVWLKSYFSKYDTWSHPNVPGENGYGHTDYIESISEEEYMVRKLAETL